MYLVTISLSYRKCDVYYEFNQIDTTFLIQYLIKINLLNES